MHFFALAKHRISRYSVDLSHNLLEADDAVRRGEGGKGDILSPARNRNRDERG